MKKESFYLEKMRERVEAYKNRANFKIGDPFLWRFSGGYGTSGNLPKHYTKTDSFYDGNVILRVCHRHEGMNAFGPFVHFYLNRTGVYDSNAFDCIIVNGPDAFKMERAIILSYVGRDSWDRPVYVDDNGRYWKDIEPRSDREPKLCTSIGNTFDGEPYTPMEYIKKYNGVMVVFDPHRDDTR